MRFSFDLFSRMTASFKKYFDERVWGMLEECEVWGYSSRYFLICVQRGAVWRPRWVLCDADFHFLTSTASSLCRFAGGWWTLWSSAGWAHCPEGLRWVFREHGWNKTTILKKKHIFDLKNHTKHLTYFIDLWLFSQRYNIKSNKG